MSEPQNSQPILTPPAVFEHQPELRAIMLLPSVPPGHMTMLVPDERFEPHLQAGEFAVIDPADKEPERGEFYLIAYGSPFGANGCSYTFCQLSRRWAYLTPGGGLFMARNPGPATEGMERVATWMTRHGEGHLSDGPFQTEHIRAKLVGRVVGVYMPPVG